jgi:hypothetical protein
MSLGDSGLILRVRRMSLSDSGRIPRVRMTSLSDSGLIPRVRMTSLIDSGLIPRVRMTSLSDSGLIPRVRMTSLSDSGLIPQVRMTSIELPAAFCTTIQCLPDFFCSLFLLLLYNKRGRPLWTTPCAFAISDLSICLSENPSCAVRQQRFGESLP